MQKKLVEEDESRFECELGTIGKKLGEIRTALNALGQLVKPMEYERACYIFWSSMASHDRRGLIQALVAFYDEYVELREGASLDDIDRLMGRWFGELGPRADIYNETWEADLEKVREDGLSTWKVW